VLLLVLAKELEDSCDNTVDNNSTRNHQHDDAELEHLQEVVLEAVVRCVYLVVRGEAALVDENALHLLEVVGDHLPELVPGNCLLAEAGEKPVAFDAEGLV